MKEIIFYYSRTGRSRHVALMLANALGIQAIEVKDPNSYRGVLGFLKAGFYASTWRRVEYELEKKVEVDDLTHLYLVGPVWASRCAPAIYSLLGDVKPGKRTLVLTNLGSDPERAYGIMEGKFGRFDGKYCVTKSKDNEQEVVQRILKEASW